MPQQTQKLLLGVVCLFLLRACWQKAHLLPSLTLSVAFDEPNAQHVRNSTSNQENSSSPHDVLDNEEFARDREFNLHTIDFSIWSQCGRRKCFYPSRVDKSVGFLVVTPQWFKRLQEGYEMAIKFEKKYNASHFMMEKPRLVNISLELSEMMDKYQWSSSNGPPPRLLSNATIDTGKEPKFFNHTLVGIQKARSAPIPHVFLKRSSSHEGRNAKTLETFEQFLKDKVHNKTQFAKTFDEEMRKLWVLLGNEPYFNVDFQVLVDAQGYAYLIDFDTYGRSPKDYIKGNKMMFGKFQKQAHAAAQAQLAATSQKD